MDSDDEQCNDLISGLPTELLQHILSFVRIRTVVRMRRLSRKWKKECESLQFICLNYREFSHWKYQKFARFVNNLLLIRGKADLHTFQLHFDHCDPLSCDDVRMWIGYAVKHNVKVLHVNLDGYDKTVLPHCIFTCASLQELNLQMGKAPDRDYEHEGLLLPDIINLPSLKSMTLCDVEVGVFCLQQVIARSPGLEVLNLINCAQHLELIDSKVLKRLTIDGFVDREKGITVAAPRLTHFKCIGWPLDSILWRERPSLESAHIDTYDCGCTFDGQSDFTRIFSRVKRLALFGLDIKVMLEKELPTCPVFESLVTLEIGEWCLIDDFYVVLRLLQLSPRLEKLTIKHFEDDKAAADSEADGMPFDAMTFQCPLLETVTIQCSKDDDGIDKIVNAMVANGVSLGKIHVAFYEDIEERDQAEWMRVRREEEKELSILNKTLKENREWIDDDKYAMSDSDNDYDDTEESFDSEYDPDDF